MHSLRVVLIDGVGSIIMLMFLYEVEMFLHREVLRVGTSVKQLFSFYVLTE